MIEQSKATTIASHRIIPLKICVLIAIIVAASTFLVLNDWAVPRKDRGSPLAAPAALLLVLIFLWLPLTFLAPFARNPAAIDALKIHHAAFTSFLIVMALTARTEHGGGVGEIFAPLIMFGLYAMFYMETAALTLALYVRRATRFTPLLWSGAMAACLGGWLAGASVWAARLPPSVVASAEAAAGDDPYCLGRHTRPVRNLVDLTGFRMTSLSVFSNDPHMLLTIEGRDGRRVMNWSYRRGGFEPVPANVQSKLGITTRAFCAPQPHFAKTLGWWPG
ncbi:hypothetical protein [Hansschlegelia plantiphila]|uniref:Uncharacterized protein n=1 Tax=Hansschlegelia plantiphila TaxID=374655 RepID=A0A9W6J0V9_9HYPH|nr:hypothetical protein [Hansschlegelia plantiphila]GLK67701.1 hypothetical protein GCM10008179_13390 [Hansschlegelia plantiphila]